MRLRLLGDVAQHLIHGGFGYDEASELMQTPKHLLIIAFREAEKRRPKRCKQRCMQRPVCPYCQSALELADAAAAAGYQRREEA